MKKELSKRLFDKALTYFPGGVNSPVRAFKSVKGTPLFIKKGNGSKIWDVDENEFIDFCCSWGPLILGHNNDQIRREVVSSVENGMSFGAPTLLENELAELILQHHNYIDKIRFVSSGTEAVMSAIRLARGYTNRNKIIKFEGCYHGHSDGLLVNAGSGLATLGTSSSSGIPKAYVEETIVLPLNNKEAIDKAFSNFKNEIAGVIIEPIPANNGLLIQDKSFLEYLRLKCSQEDSLLLFDEVISGFRIGFEGAAGYYDIQPDIITYGKIIGGGMPVGAYAANNDIMENIAPDGNVYQAGTLSGNPIAMAAGIAQLKECLRKDFYESLQEKTDYLTNGIMDIIKAKNYPMSIQSIGSIFWINFSEKQIKDASSIDPSGMDKFKVLHSELLERGIYLGPSGYEVGFLSAAHTLEDLDGTIKAFQESLSKVF